jgi:hypothetical protein
VRKLAAGQARQRSCQQDQAMKLDLQHLLLLGLLSTSAHWIIARSKAMRWFWSRARGWRAALLACPACSGFWLGVGLSVIGVKAVTVACPVPQAVYFAEALASGVLATILTPVFQGVMIWGLSVSAIEPEPEPTSPLAEIPGHEPTRVSPQDIGPPPTHPRP